ncbi:hypothetical protein BGX27_001211 [Mortierella sp. AM989]|nr:hypothetical protein BGX27_001211 [Mortierella sp. AM989]
MPFVYEGKIIYSTTIPGPEIEMAPTLDEAISEWKYTPLHSNPTVAATLAYLNFMTASQELGFSFVGTVMEYGHIHLTECLQRRQQQSQQQSQGQLQNNGIHSGNQMEWTYGFANRPYYLHSPTYLGLSDRDVSVALSQWRYEPLHPDPVSAAVLAHMNFDAANKAVGFSFAEAMMQLGQEHLGECIIPKQNQGPTLSQVSQAPLLVPQVTPVALQVTPVSSRITPTVLQATPATPPRVTLTRPQLAPAVPQVISVAPRVTPVTPQAALVVPQIKMISPQAISIMPQVIQSMPQAIQSAPQVIPALPRKRHANLAAMTYIQGNSSRERSLKAKYLLEYVMALLAMVTTLPEYRLSANSI